MNEEELEAALKLIAQALTKRRLHIAPFDGQGNFVTWLDPALVSIKICTSDRAYSHRPSVFIRQVVGRDLDEADVSQITDEMVARGKRFAMAGSTFGQEKTPDTEVSGVVVPIR